MKYLILFTVFIGVNTVLNAQENERDNYKVIRNSYPLSSSEIRIKNDYADKIRLKAWDKDSIRVDARILLVDDKNQIRNNDFDISFNKSGSISSLTMEIKNLKANSVYQKSGSDYNPQKSKTGMGEELLVGTEVTIYIPKAVNVEFESKMGDVTVDHNGANLLITTNNKILLNIEKSLNANITLSSLYGDIKVTRDLNILQSDNLDGKYRQLNNSKKTSYVLNKGGIEISLISLGGITINSKN